MDSAISGKQKEIETIDINKLASIEFTLEWESMHASHTDSYFVRRVNFWRDLLPRKVYDAIMGMKKGDLIEFSHTQEEILPPYNPDNKFDIENWQFNKQYLSQHIIEPRFGRFYPKGILKGIPDVFKGNKEPLRCVGITDDKILVDFNHPLNRNDIKLTISIHDVRKKHSKHGGECIDWMETITAGPGMQARCEGKPTDFFSVDAFRRSDESEDTVFYNKSRFVTHIDDCAISIIKGLYGIHLRDGMKVLDLMSSWRSHIPNYIKLKSFVGLGLNKEEMSENHQLTDYVIHDLNNKHALPFSNEEFDAVICTVSVEYLIQPLEVFEDIARILKPGGYFIVTFSNRWFPPKVIKLWSDIHEFERLGLVLEYFLRTDKYRNLETYSMRGLPRPENDKYYPGVYFSDPVYAVWGLKV